MKVEILKGFTMREAVSGELVSYRKGAIVTVDDELATALINDGFAKEDKRVVPEGTIEITENGENIDVATYAKADVNVPSTEPTGTVTVLGNGIVDVKDYAEVDVRCPLGMVVFYPEEGTFPEYPENQQIICYEIQYGESIDVSLNGVNAPRPPAGMTFAGWKDDDDNIILSHNGEFYFKKTTDLYAQFGDSAIITLNPNGGNGSERQINAAVDYPTVDLYRWSFQHTNPNKYLAGWGTTSDATEPVETIDGFYTPTLASETLYAIWGDKATVSFDVQNGSGNPQSKIGAIGYPTIYSEPTQNEVTPPVGFALAGWGTTPDAEVPVQFPYTPTAAQVTLYAIYRRKAKVTFDANGGLGRKNVTGAINYPFVDEPLDTEFRHMYDRHLSGWAEDRNSRVPVQFPYTPTAIEVTLYAIWGN